MILIYLLFSFWLLRQLKSQLFWIYLWQLKEYHLGRFIDHFRTAKGKRIFLNFLFLFKIFLLFVSFCFRHFPLFYFLFFIFLLEALKFLKDFFEKRVIVPIFTKKVIFLNTFSFSFLLFFLFSIFENKNFLLLILTFDILNPAIFSGIVLIFQPLTAFFRYQIIKRAIKKRETFKNLLVIGITGSYGKTSTKEFLGTILEQKFPRAILKTEKHQNSEIAVSKCILEKLNENHRIFIVEMGAYNKGGISLLAKIAKPKIAILTGVNEQHLALFGSMENLISAEGGKELIESLPEDGLVIFNGENKILREIYEKTKIRKKIVGVQKKDFDLWAGNIKVKRKVLFFQVFSKDGGSADFNLNLIGKQNIENILLAACCAKELGMSLKEISLACQKITQEQTGVKLIKTKKGFNIIDATYSANPDSVIAHLEYLKTWPGKRVIIMPCLIELGSKSEEIHKKIGQKIGKICDLAIIITKDKFSQIKEGALENGMKKEHILFSEDPKEIFERIKNFNEENDIILLEGRIKKEIQKILCE